MHNTTFQLQPISDVDADRLRASGGEVYIADSEPGYPCRQCLRDAEIGDELILVSYDPFTAESPYRSASPIFLHRFACPSVRESNEQSLPLQLTRRQLSVRSFNKEEMMIDAEVIDGSHLADTLGKFFGDDEAELVRIHNAGRGCWATDVGRTSGV